MHGRRLVIGADRAASPAGRRPEAGRSGFHVRFQDLLRVLIAGMQLRREGAMVERPSEHRAMAGDDGDAEALRSLCDEQVADARLRRRQQAARRRVRRVLEPVACAIDADQHFDPVVVRREFLVGNRPVESQPVTALRLEVVGAVPKRVAAPVICPPAQHAGTPPVESPRIVVSGVDVGFARNLPSAVDRCVVEPEWLVSRRRAAERRLAGAVKHRSLGLRYVLAPRLEHQNTGAFHRERIGSLPACRARSDDDHVVLAEGVGGDERHRRILASAPRGRGIGRRAGEPKSHWKNGPRCDDSGIHQERACSFAGLVHALAKAYKGAGIPSRITLRR